MWSKPAQGLGVLHHHEIRLFFKSEDENTLLRLLRRDKRLKELRFVKPFTETVYFTSGADGKYTLPVTNVRLRLRRYVATHQTYLSLKSPWFYCELKFLDHRHNTCKLRKRVQALSVVKDLVSQDVATRANIFHRRMARQVPTGATRTYRRHFRLRAIGRMTIDTQIELFGFSSENPNAAERICELPEGKIEFKLKKDLFLEEILEQSGLLNAWDSHLVYAHDSEYLETQSRRIFMKWIQDRS